MMLGELSAAVRGAGPPLALLHGNSEDGHVFDRMLPYLDGFTLIVLDSRGHGRSPRGRRPLTIRQLAVDVCRSLLEYRRLMGQGPFGLIGFSDGANLGLEIAIHRPDLLAAEVLMGGNATPAALKPWTRAEILAGYWGMRAAGTVSPSARRRADVWGLMVGQPGVTRSQMETVTVPTMIMVGARDVVPRRESQAMARLIPGAEWVELAGEGHLLPRTAPRVAGELAAAFLTRQMVR
ncbi:MAG: alpha/beta hydrolase [Bifidobacteriaceae bacterium]|jgi:pimeloyl-ACP methyl ester carboxylesterase|nr:alpha/beta hydrolase [Bifidobacteriaceae bacterium]